MQINLYSIPPLLCSILVLSIGLLVFLNKHKSSANQTFFLLCFSITIWLSFYSINFTLLNTNSNYLLIPQIYKIAYCGISFIAITTFHFTTVFFEIKWTKIWNIINYNCGLFISLLILKTNLIIKEPKLFFWGLYPQAGALHPYFLIYFIFLILSSFMFIFLPIPKERNNPIKNNQKKYVLISLFIFSLASLDFIPNYGIEFYPFGYLPTLIFVLIIAYAAIKVQLMDIHIVIRKSIIYTVLLLFISVLYLILVLTSEKLIQNIIGYQSTTISIFIAFIIGVAFFPLKNKIQYLTDKYFFKGSQFEISEQNKQLRQEIAQSAKYKTLSTLSTGIAHEVKNPLTAIKTFAEYLPHKLDDKEFLSKFANIVGREVNRIDDMVHQLLNYGKPAPLSIKAINIHKLINSTIDILNSKFINQKIHVNKHFDADKDLNLYVDPNQFRQALLNILLNAIEAMPNGGKLRVNTKRLSENFEIVISDTGCGMAEDDLPQIFDPFFSRKDQGTGLGLSITQSLVENHKGTIEVKSAVGTGTEITIKLPLSHITPASPGREAD